MKHLLASLFSFVLLWVTGCSEPVEIADESWGSVGQEVASPLVAAKNGTIATPGASGQLYAWGRNQKKQTQLGIPAVDVWPTMDPYAVGGTYTGLSSLTMYQYGTCGLK